MSSTWGVTPDELRIRLQEQEWERSERLRARLSGERAFPLRASLRPPTGRHALANLDKFRDYVRSWAVWNGPGKVTLEVRKLPQIGETQLPTHYQLDSMSELASFLGGDAQQDWERWQTALEPINTWDANAAVAVCRRLDWLDSLTPEHSEKCVAVLRQLNRGMGRGGYLRSLPLRGVDTKFLEDNLRLLIAMHGASSAQGNDRGDSSEDFLMWLNCSPRPSHWLLIRALDPMVREALGGLDVLKLPASELHQTELPGTTVLLVENMEPAFSLPELPGTLAICGFGNNLGWLAAPWLAQRRLGYWGDLDTWGLNFLASARREQPHVQPIMMDLATLKCFREGMGLETAPNPALPDGLTEDETSLYHDLLSERYGGRGLEQERIPQDHVVKQLQRWAKSRDVS
nr:hypothetical protein [Oceanococcus sp. HetDA_MAG_MS8]